MLTAVGGSYCPDQAFSIRTALGVELGSSRWVRSADLRQLLLWWLNSPWAPGHICGVSTMLVVVVVLLFFGSHAGTHQIRDQSRALEDRNDSNNSLEDLHT